MFSIFFYFFLRAVIISVWMIFAAHKYYTGHNTCDGWVMAALITLSVIFVIYGGWRKEPVCLFVLNAVLCASAFAAPIVKKVVKKIVKKHGKKVAKKVVKKVIVT